MEDTALLMYTTIDELSGGKVAEALIWTAARHGTTPERILALVAQSGGEQTLLRRAEASYARVCGKVVQAQWQIRQLLDRAEALHAALPPRAYAVMKTPPHKRPGVFKSRPTARAALAGHRAALAEAGERAEAAREALRAAIARATTQRGRTDAIWAACETLESLADTLEGELGGAHMALGTLKFIEDPHNRDDPGL